MKEQLLIACVLAGVCSACSTLDLPTVEESQRAIDRMKPQIAFAEKAINATTMGLPRGSDVITRMRQPGLNRILNALAANRSDDLRLTFFQTRPLFSETRSVLGLTYTNQLDLDSGSLHVNLRQVQFTRFDRNRVEAVIDLEGKGRVHVSGRYTGIPARAAPELELWLKENIELEISAGEQGMMILKPVNRTVTLKAKMSISLLEWKIPWSRDIALQLSDILPPIAIPTAIGGELPFPVPARQAGDERMEMQPHRVELYRSSVSADGNVLEFRTDFSMTRNNPK